ncbi:unnamed protein product, partial [Chrysoparadoxa australica]
GGLDTFNRFLGHISSYSVMQVMKHLMLPKLAAMQEMDALSFPSAMDDQDEEELSPEASWCSWCQDESIMMTLIEESARPSSADDSSVHSHIAELLLCLISQSAPESPFFTTMYSQAAVGALVKAAARCSGGEDSGEVCAGATTAPLQILEALTMRFLPPQPDLSQTGLSSLTGQPMMHGGRGSANAGHCSAAPALADRGEFAAQVGKLVPSITACLRSHTAAPPTITNQTDEQKPRLGLVRLKIAELVDALVKLDEPAADQALVDNGTINTCLDLFFAFGECSLLHEAVSNMVLTVLKGDSRDLLQRHLIEDCQLLERLLEAADAKDRDSNAGHALLMSEAILDAEAGLPTTEVEALQLPGEIEVEVEGEGEVEGREEAVEPPTSPSPATDANADADADADAVPAASLVKTLVECHACAERWRDYAGSALADALKLQAMPLGGFPIPSREEENQLSTDFPDDDGDLEDGGQLMEQLMRQMQIHSGDDDDDDGLGGGTWPEASGFGDNDDWADFADFGNKQGGEDGGHGAFGVWGATPVFGDASGGDDERKTPFDDLDDDDDEEEEEEEEEELALAT